MLEEDAGVVRDPENEADFLEDRRFVEEGFDG